MFSDEQSFGTILSADCEHREGELKSAVFGECMESEIHPKALKLPVDTQGFPLPLIPLRRNIYQASPTFRCKAISHFRDIEKGVV